MELEPISSTRWDLGFNNAYILNRNFMAQWGELTCLFDVDCYKSFRTVRYNSWTPPESEIVEEYYSVLFKEAWTDTRNIELPAWIQNQLEEQLLKILKDEY